MICLAISGDPENDPDVLAMNGASAALCLSGIPFERPGRRRPGRPGRRQVRRQPDDGRSSSVSQLELVIAGTEDAVLMVEAGAKEVSEETMLEAIAFGHARVQAAGRASRRSWCARAGKPRWAFDPDGRARTWRWPRGCASLAARKLAAALAHPREAGAGRGGQPRVRRGVAAPGLDETKKGAVRGGVRGSRERRGAPA